MVRGVPLTLAGDFKKSQEAEEERKRKEEEARKKAEEAAAKKAADEAEALAEAERKKERVAKGEIFSESAEALPETGDPFVFRDPQTGQPIESLSFARGGSAQGARGAEGLISAQGAAARNEFLRVGTALAGQVGQLDPSQASATPIDFDQAFRQGVVGSIPSALRLAAQAGIGAAAIGAIATAPAGGIGAVPAAAIGATVGFVAGIVGGMTSDMASQRTDNTNAQQRVLDEGKQTLMDWVTLSKADPANRQFYLKQFNIQLQLIQDAHVQMLTDTNADVAKFESAIPNLAEFSTFYSVGGERDALVNEMKIALITLSEANFEMLSLANRRGAI